MLLQPRRWLPAKLTERRDSSVKGSNLGHKIRMRELYNFRSLVRLNPLIKLYNVLVLQGQPYRLDAQYEDYYDHALGLPITHFDSGS